MAKTLDEVAGALDGDVVGARRLDPSITVDGAIALEDFVLVGHPDYATLVVADRAGIRDLLDSRDASADSRVSALRSAVLVTHDRSRVLREALEQSPFTAIVGAGRAQVSLLPEAIALLAVDEAAEDRLVTTGTRVLTQVARRGGVPAVVAELAHRIDGWAVLLDPHGEFIASAGAGRLHVDDARAVAFGRQVRVRHPGLQVHHIGSGEDLSGYLVVASRQSSTSRGRALAAQCAALLDLLLRRHDQTATERLGRDVMIEALLSGGATAAELLRRWDVHESALTGFMISARSKAVDLERLMQRWLDDLGSVHIVTERHGGIMGFVRDEHAEALASLVENFESGAGMPLRLGLGSSAPVDALARSSAEAQRAHETAVAENRSVVRYQSLPTVRFVLDRLGGDSVGALADVLEPLRADPAPLVETLRAFLALNGAWGAAAVRLGVHRQTLAARVRAIEALTGLSLSDPDDRAAAWLSLRASERV
ncbi:PucR family transcriptional regulator [Ruicaihuangia caeni]|uniref:PucR family transcriptional regulator n=1 Tax=Ruicaihuangia caeni TaxID=3042517 RepID=UPI00338E24F9